MGMGGQHHPPAALPPGERPGTHFTGDWIIHKAGLDECEKSRHHRLSIPELPSP